jgi:4-carboxymuconolactone decarboxylase
MREDEREEQGMLVRRAVLGDGYVERTLANRTPFNEDFQRFITRYAWGEVWSDETLPRHTRSLVTVALLVALGREQELRLHLQGARRNGVTADEVKALLLHCAIYCGVPAANSAFRIAGEVFASASASGESATLANESGE